MDYTTPCFILDEQELTNNIGDFHSVLSSYFNHYAIGYSFKTNSLPRVLEIVKKSNVMAEVVSEDEYELALKIGFDEKCIIYNGPIKSKRTFEKAVLNNSIINIDSYHELEWLEELAKSCDDIRIGIRVNYDLESYLPGHTSTAEIGGRFGFCYENGKLKDAIDRINNIANVKLVGLHMHVSNATKNSAVYDNLTRMACRIATEYKLQLEYIDIGGGFFGGGDGGKKYREYAEVIHNSLVEEGYQDICLIVEPGASVIATALSYCTTVEDVKDTTYGRFVICDGTRLHIDSFMNKYKYSYSIYRMSDDRENIEKQVICGYTCMEKDRMMAICDEKELVRGDVIKYSIVGSYSMCFNPLFISYLPRVYSKRDNNYYLVRDKWGVEEYLQKNYWK